MERIYHIYAKNNCLVHSIKEEEFNCIWNTIKNLVTILDSDYSESDLSYEELSINKEILLNSSY
jgi:hypothetical protein